jgi:tight adherence protein B
MTPDGSGLVIVLAALAGGMCALAAREAVLATPSVARWVTTAVEPLLRAGREGYEPSDAERRRLAVVGAAALAAAALLILGPVPAAIVAVAGPTAAASVLARRRARYRRAVERGVPEIAGAVADALAGGRSVRGALGAAAASLDGPDAVEMSRVRADLELGASTSEALAALQGRMRSGRVDSLVAALVSQQLGGGNLAALLRRHAAAAADRDRVAADARAATAQARFTGLLVVAMPTGAALFAELLEPGFMARILGDPAAAVLLVLAGLLQLGGFAAIRRLSRIAE